MPGYTRRIEYKESEYAKDLVAIMRSAKGPLSRSDLAEALNKIYPSLYRRDLMNEVSSAIQLDRWAKKNRFKKVPGGYVLT